MKKSKDLPDGLRFDPRRETYYYRGTHRHDRSRKEIGKVSRDEAIKAWVKITQGVRDDAEGGTVAEIIDRYVSDELPSRIERKKIASATADEYKRLAPKLRDIFGDRRYALDVAQAARGGYLRVLDINLFLRKAEGKRGAIQANRMIALLSAMFAFARRCGMTEYNPCMGAERNTEKAREQTQGSGVLVDLYEAASPVLKLMIELDDATGMRQADIRLLQRTQIKDGELHVSQGKTGNKQRFEITPAVQSVLDRAKKLRGSARSLYVFPTPEGTPYTIWGVQSMWRRARAKAGVTGVQFKDIRTWSINEAERRDGSGQSLAGHADPRTTTRHYLNEPKKVTPIR